jgi:hypothetical protein
MVSLRWVAPPQVSHPTPGRVAPLRLYGSSHVPWPPTPSVQAGRYKVHVDIPAHSTDPTMMAWFTTAQGDNLDDTLERAAHQALTKFCEHYLPVLGNTTIALLPI